MAVTINDGKTCATLSKLSKKFGIYIMGGSIIERDGVNLYNTSTVWNSNGELIARHRKASKMKGAEVMVCRNTQCIDLINQNVYGLYLGSSM